MVVICVVSSRWKFLKLVLVCFLFVVVLVMVLCMWLNRLVL